MAFDSESAKQAGKKSSRKGVPNKSTVEIRDSFMIILEDNLPNITVWLEQIAEKNPEKALRLVIKIAEFVLPRLQRMEFEEELRLEPREVDLSQLSTETLKELEKAMIIT
jgi:hypothetical protein